MLISQYFRRLIFAGCVGLSVLSTPLKSAELITLTNSEWPPFTSKHLPHQGFYSEIVRQAFALEGYQVEYQFLPWARAYMYVKQGEVDGSLTWAKTEQKELEVLFSDPVFWHTKVFFHLSSKPFEWQNISDLHGYRIGATELYTYGHAFDSAARNEEINVEYVSSDLLNFKKMLLDRVQLFPSDIMVGKTLIQQHFTAEQAALFTYHPKPIQQTYTHVIFSKKNSERNQLLLAAFNRGLAKLKSSGRYQQIIDNATLDTPE
ncbi:MULTISPECIES: substrate-binding periplasmic protein [unclassified Agarivorans]|uniref:substrate-binding periplasmic protein n=1 Tax=unclassified Agarivorans TaxID=2636026 RepID=UPI0026E2CD72|nr:MULTISPECIES: transporter substrate-binding domain-containing protein [unclassified Agarivorans]MDO6684340.1 transporter substrate-binding domain-containing protein [Agarivorans sp. 3_MG-2023]MDO6714505.1 transporter substrate-binding domain-containing protein [Agarivorans sp. 2_MG-2023]